MIFFVTYDPKDGRITGRIKSSAPDLLKYYDYIIMIDEAQFEAEPEVHKKVDLGSKQLIDKD